MTEVCVPALAAQTAVLNGALWIITGVGLSSRVHAGVLLSQLVTDGDGRRLGSSVRRGGTVVSTVQRLWGAAAAAVAVSAPVASAASTPSPCPLT